MLKKSKNLKDKDGQDMLQIIRFQGEKKLREAKLKIHIALFKELHRQMTQSGDGSILE